MEIGSEWEEGYVKENEKVRPGLERENHAACTGGQ